jgi:uncharacterized phiE125 gp8 family phage protein
MAIQDATPVTLAEMRAFLNITESGDTGQDSVLENLLDDLTVAIEDYIGVALVTKSYDEYYDGDGSDTLLVKRIPIVAITSLADGTTSYAAADYYLYKEEGKIILDDDTFEIDHQNIHIVYTAGLGAARANVPRSIKVALKMWVAHVYRKHTAILNNMFSGSVNIDFGSEDMPKEVAQKLEPYRLLRVGGM